MEMRNALLDNRGKAIFVNKLAKNLAEWCFCPSALWKVEFVSVEITYMAEKIFKQSVEEEFWFLFTAHSKMQEERNYLKT